MDCGTCRSSYDCQTLSTVLTILQKHLDEISDQKFLGDYRRVIQRLNEAGWAYPGGERHCALEGATTELRGMIDLLIRDWRQHSSAVAHGAMAPSCHAEELHRD